MAAETPDPSTALPAADVDEPLPLDDLRWAPLDNAGMRLSPHLGGHSIAAHDLSGTLATAGLRCLIRYRAPGGVWVRVRVSFLCWAGYRLAAGSDGKLSIGRRRDWPREGYSELDLKHCGDPRANGQPFSQIGFGQGVLFCWRSDLERIWPGVFVPTSVRTEETETEKTAVPVKPLTPEQKVLIAIFVLACFGVDFDPARVDHCLLLRNNRRERASRACPSDSESRCAIRLAIHSSISDSTQATVRSERATLCGNVPSFWPS